jgi:hypothetical protein
MHGLEAVVVGEEKLLLVVQVAEVGSRWRAIRERWDRAEAPAAGSNDGNEERGSVRGVREGEAGSPWGLLTGTWWSGRSK